MVRHRKCSTNTAGYYNRGVQVLAVFDHLRIMTPSSGFWGEPVWVNTGATGCRWGLSRSSQFARYKSADFAFHLLSALGDWCVRWGGVVAGMRNANPRLLYWRTPSPVGGSVWEAYGALRRRRLAAGSMLLSAGFGELQLCLLLFSVSCVWLKTWVASFLLQPSAMLFPPWWTLTLRLRKLTNPVIF